MNGRPLGITIIGGMVFSQLLTLYTTPVIYLAFERLAKRWGIRTATSLDQSIERPVASAGNPAREPHR